MTGLPTSYKTIAAYGDEYGYSSYEGVSVTDKQPCEAFF